jgi:NhaP-type Na+/H+ or K+/H+ antiporter
MRGAITLAALLAVPRTTHAGGALVGRDDIIYLGFAVIITTLVLQGMTLPLLVKRLGLPEHPSVAQAEQRARLSMVDAVLEHLDAGAADEAVSPELLDALRAQYLARRRRLQMADDPGEANHGAGAVDGERTFRQELIGVQRHALEELRRSAEIGTTTMRSIQHELDLEDARLIPARRP